jgi:hypothetical protein
LTEGSRLYFCLADVAANNAKVLAFQLSCLTAASNAYDLLDTDSQKMLQELVQGMVSVAPIIPVSYIIKVIEEV